MFAFNVNAKTYILMDIDNTLFRNGEPIKEMIEKARSLQEEQSVHLYFLTGRNKNEFNENKLREWFKNQALDIDLIRLKENKDIKTAVFKHSFLVKELNFTTKRVSRINFCCSNCS